MTEYLVEVTLRHCRRPLSGIVVCTVYHPPGIQDHIALNEYLINTTDRPSTLLVFLGDFNDFDVCNLAINHNLKQVVKQPTGGNAIL